MLTRLSGRLRAQLTEQNWLSVALDLVIVVVGVFLGIEAANWNESRKERSEERRYYAQILDDLEQDQHSLRIAQQRADQFDAAAEGTLLALEEGRPPNVSPGRVAARIHYAGFLYIPRASRGTYDELISTGNLGLLRDGEAKSAIAEYYSQFEELRQWDELLRSQQGRYWEVTAGILPRRALRTAVRMQEPDVTAEEASQMLDRLRERPGAHDLLISMAAHQERVRRDSKGISDLGRRLIAKLQPLAAN